MLARAILAVLGLCLSSPAAAEGCWVRFFEQENFESPLGRLAGALYINSLTGPGLIGQMDQEEFFRRARSVRVGPQARVFAYAEPGFRKPIIALEPNREVKDLHALGFAKEVASLKVLCAYR